MSIVHTIKNVTFIAPFLGNSVLLLLDKVGILALLSLLGLPVNTDSDACSSRPFTRITAAGTAQVFHLIPLKPSTKIQRLAKSNCKGRNFCIDMQTIDKNICE